MSRIGRVWMFCLGLLKKPIFYFCLTFILLNLFFTKQILNSNGLGGFLIVGLVEILVEIVLISLVYYLRKKGTSLEKQFLLVAIVLGAMFIILLPPGQSPDEITHFRRAYGISEGILVPNEKVDDSGAVGSDIPINTVFLERNASHGTYLEITKQIGLSSEETSKQSYTSAALYNFICYIPQALAVLIGKILNFSVLGIAYLMEIFDFIVWTFFIYFAIKLIPRFKIIVMFIALFPITLQEATSLSPDALTIGLSVFFISYILYLAYEQKKKLSKKQLAILLVISLVIGLCKIVYLPLVLLLLIIPVEKFGSKKKKWIFLCVLFSMVAILNLTWLAVSSNYLIEYRTGVDSKTQLMGILKNPVTYLMVVIRTLNACWQDWALNTFGLTLGYFNFVLPSILFFTSFAITVLLFGQRSEALKIKKFDRIMFALVFLIIVMLILTSLYMQWNPVGSSIIEGVQGRYFLPIMLLVPIMISRRSNKEPHMDLISQDMVIFYGLFVNVAALLTIFVQNV